MIILVNLQITINKKSHKIMINIYYRNSKFNIANKLFNNNNKSCYNIKFIIFIK